jgi:hypothetical protein
MAREMTAETEAPTGATIDDQIDQARPSTPSRLSPEASAAQAALLEMGGLSSLESQDPRVTTPSDSEASQIDHAVEIRERAALGAAVVDVAVGAPA